MINMEEKVRGQACGLKKQKKKKNARKNKRFMNIMARWEKAQIPLEKSGRDARGMNNAFDASRDEGELQSY